jgi:xylose isomerase
MKIDFAEINSTLSNYSSYAGQQIGELITKGNQYKVKIIQLTVDCFQHPKYAKGGVVLANIGIFFIAFEAAYIVDTLFDRMQLTDDQLNQRQITAKCIVLLGTFAGTFTALNVGLSKALAPNTSLKMHALLAAVTGVVVPILYFTRTWLKS